MRWAVVLLALAACSDPGAPYLGLGVGLGSGGVSVTPSVSTHVGPTSVTVDPYGAGIGTSFGNVGVAVGGGF